MMVHNPFHLLLLSKTEAIIKFSRNNFLLDIEVFSFNIAIQRTKSRMALMAQRKILSYARMLTYDVCNH